MVADALEFDEEAVDADELKVIANQSISADRASKEETGAFDYPFLYHHMVYRRG
jgi:hypothetical protein